MNAADVMLAQRLCDATRLAIKAGRNAEVFRRARSLEELFAANGLPGEYLVDLLYDSGESVQWALDRLKNDPEEWKQYEASRVRPSGLSPFQE